MLLRGPSATTAPTRSRRRAKGPSTTQLCLPGVHRTSRHRARAHPTQAGDWRRLQARSHGTFSGGHTLVTQRDLVLGLCQGLAARTLGTATFPYSNKMAAMLLQKNAGIVGVRRAAPAKPTLRSVAVQARGGDSMWYPGEKQRTSRGRRRELRDWWKPLTVQWRYSDRQAVAL